MTNQEKIFYGICYGVIHLCLEGTTLKEGYDEEKRIGEIFEMCVEFVDNVYICELTFKRRQQLFDLAINRYLLGEDAPALLPDETPKIVCLNLFLGRWFTNKFIGDLFDKGIVEEKDFVEEYGEWPDYNEMDKPLSLDFIFSVIPVHIKGNTPDDELDAGKVSREIQLPFAHELIQYSKDFNSYIKQQHLLREAEEIATKERRMRQEAARLEREEERKAEAEAAAELVAKRRAEREESIQPTEEEWYGWDEKQRLKFLKKLFGWK